MREIKFRGKRKDNGKWVFGYLLTIKRYNGIDYHINATNSIGKVIPETVGQFTGLYDKNGKEIYEGDIVKTISLRRVIYKHWDASEELINTVPEHEFYQIKYNEGKFQLFKNDDFSGAILNWGQNGQAETLEVIGNIYDNPELINQLCVSAF